MNIGTLRVNHTGVGVLVLPDYDGKTYVGLILRKAGRQKLQKDGSIYTEDRRWKFPGGGCESEETPRQGMLREVRRESGLVVSENAVLASYEIQQPSSRPGSDICRTHFFLVEIGFEVPVVPIEETDEVERFDLFEIGKIPGITGDVPMTKSHLLALRRLLAMIYQPWAEKALIKVEIQIAHDMPPRRAA